VALDQRNTVASIRDDGLGMSEKPDYVTLKGSVTYIRHDNDPWYAACPNAGCNKKVFVFLGLLNVK
jgi:replication factor A1